MSSMYLKRLNDGRYEYGDLILREGKYEEVPRGNAPNYDAGCKGIRLTADPDLADPGHKAVAVTAGECRDNPVCGRLERVSPESSAPAPISFDT